MNGFSRSVLVAHSCEIRGRPRLTPRLILLLLPFLYVVLVAAIVGGFFVAGLKQPIVTNEACCRPVSDRSVKCWTYLATCVILLSYMHAFKNMH